MAKVKHVIVDEIYFKSQLDIPLFCEDNIFIRFHNLWFGWPSYCIIVIILQNNFNDIKAYWIIVEKSKLQFLCPCHKMFCHTQLNFLCLLSNGLDGILMREYEVRVCMKLSMIGLRTCTWIFKIVKYTFKHYHWLSTRHETNTNTL